MKQGPVEARQEDVVITAEMVTARSKKIPNWRAPGPYERMADHMNDLINIRGTIPVWMIPGKTVLCQNDQERDSAVDNYRPIFCLPLALKLMTGIAADSMHEFFVQNDALPVEQNGCGR